MKFKKAVSAIAALASICSAFAIAPVANAYTADERTTYYIGEKDAPETFDDYTNNGWSSDGFTFNSDVFMVHDHGFGVKNNVLKLKTLNKERTFTYTLSDNISEGKIVFVSDIVLCGASKVPESYISFKDSSGNNVAKLAINHAVENTTSLNAKTTDILENKTAIDRDVVPREYNISLNTIIDLDNNIMTMEYVAPSENSSSVMITETMEVEIDENATVSSIDFLTGVGDITGYFTLDNTTLYSYQTKEAWQFENLPISQYNSNDSQLCFNISYVDVNGAIAPVTTNQTVSDFIDKFASETAKTYLSGNGEVTFGIIITNIDLNQSIHKVYITPDENTDIELASGAFEADAEIDDSEFIEIGDSEFDVE